ncbi:hypothetical protein ACNKHX_23925 [Shigella flexneri]
MLCHIEVFCATEGVQPAEYAAAEGREAQAQTSAISASAAWRLMPSSRQSTTPLDRMGIIMRAMMAFVEILFRLGGWLAAEAAGVGYLLRLALLVRS